MKNLMQLAITGGGLLALLCAPAQAGLNYKIFEDASGNLTIETEGSLVLPTPSSLNYCSPSGLFQKNPYSAICTGPDAGSAIMPVYDLTGPDAFSAGSGALDPASAVSGLSTALFVFPPFFKSLFLDSSYVSGTPIVSNAIFAGKTLADIGLTPSSGNLGTWTLSNNETISVDVVSNVVPGPLPVLGAGAAFGFSRKLRRRIKLSQPAAKA